MKNGKCKTAKRLEEMMKKLDESPAVQKNIETITESDSYELSSIAFRLNRIENRMDEMEPRIKDMHEILLQILNYVEKQEAMEEGQQPGEESDLTDEEEERVKQQQESVDGKKCNCPICSPHMYIKPNAKSYIDSMTKEDMKKFGVIEIQTSIKPPPKEALDQLGEHSRKLEGLLRFLNENVKKGQEKHHG